MIKNSTEFKHFYEMLKSSKHSHHSFCEFFCWYIHLAYAWAIDVLVENDVMTFPSEYFTSIILYREGLEGILVS